MKCQTQVTKIIGRDQQPSDMQMTYFNSRSKEELKSSYFRIKEKAGLKLNIKKLRTYIHFMAMDSDKFYFPCLNIFWMVTVARISILAWKKKHWRWTYAAAVSVRFQPLRTQTGSLSGSLLPYFPGKKGRGCHFPPNEWCESKMLQSQSTLWAPLDVACQSSGFQGKSIRVSCHFSTRLKS